MPTAFMIFNPSSGSHLHRGEALAESVAALEAAGVGVTTLDGPLSRQLDASLASSADIIVVSGGDGTIRAAIEAHRGHGRPIGILPGGTMNLLASDYGIPTDLAAAANVIAAGHTMPVDYGLIDGRIFLHTAFLGLPVRIGAHREAWRGRMSLFQQLRLGFHALSTIARDPQLTMTAEDDDGDLTLNARTYAIMVGSIEPHFLSMPHRSAVTGGILTVFALRASSGIDLARLVLLGAVGALADDPTVDQRTIRHATIEGPRRRIKAMLDGEGTLVHSPCAVEVRSGEVSVLTPPPVEAPG
ncbi:diacylglycerol/lipid kinase family protein [Acuticoccus mangrovi]|uniref:NAD(+)/NADH kinase n=1 Tax=Acuticoccus mangrovi TaxID=2796142 RepID=A0A934IQI2_9HYPH|nr:diacylglycerol kinase family protein [Acuticoccus mangrovi]MBJ3778232.1 NAD(+)/NADH kinase [Acuticoccus mangrovi]